MSSPRFEVPIGTIDGVNTVFTVSRPYGAGTTAVFINGQLMERSLDDGWFETDPGAGIITLKEAPRSSGACPDVLQVFYLDTAPPLPETQILKLRGVVRTSLPIRGTLSQSQEIKGVISEGGKITGQVELRKRLRSTVSEVTKIRGRIQVCKD